MKDAWFQRLLEKIEADGRSYREISKAARCGPNFVQQLIKDQKDPRASQLSRLLETLGPGSDIYVMAGLQVSQADLEFLRIVANLDSEARKDALAVLRRMAGTPDEPKQSPSDREEVTATAESFP